MNNYSFVLHGIRKYITLISCAVVLLCSSLVSIADEEADYSEYAPSVRTVDGINFSVPADRPIKKVHGLLTPMPLDEYMAMKFSKQEERIRSIEDSINKIEEDIALIKNELKKDLKSLKNE